MHLELIRPREQLTEMVGWCDGSWADLGRITEVDNWWAFGRNEKKNTTIQNCRINKKNARYAYFKCWLNRQVASFEALLSLEKTIDDPTPSWSAVPFFASCRTQTIFFVVTERCTFLGTEKKRPRRTSPSVTKTRHVFTGSLLNASTIRKVIATQDKKCVCVPSFRKENQRDDKNKKRNNPIHLGRHHSSLCGRRLPRGKRVG